MHHPFVLKMHELQMLLRSEVLVKNGDWKQGWNLIQKVKSFCFNLKFEKAVVLWKYKFEGIGGFELLRAWKKK